MWVVMDEMGFVRLGARFEPTTAEIGFVETRNLTVWFENDRLVKAEGNALEYARQQQSAATE